MCRGGQESKTFKIRTAGSRRQWKLAFVSRITRILSFVVAAVAVEVHATAQSVQLQYGSPVAPIESRPGEAFLQRFEVAFDRRVDEQFVDRFHPFNVMNWKIELANGGSDHVRDSAVGAMRGAFAKSVTYGVREATVDLPIMFWLKERQGLLADFLRNSVDSVAEEAVSPLDTSYRPVERSWWERVKESGKVRYGIRPFQTSPYSFLSLALKDGDTVFLLCHLRYYYRHFADHRFEIALSVPLARGLAVDVGSSYQFGQHPKEDGLVVKLFKEFKSGGILHVGLEAQEHPTFFAGIALPW